MYPELPHEQPCEGTVYHADPVRKSRRYLGAGISGKRTPSSSAESERVVSVFRKQHGGYYS